MIKSFYLTDRRDETRFWEPAQNRLGKNGKEGLPNIPQSSRTGELSSDSLVSHPGRLFVEVTSLHRSSQHILQPGLTSLTDGSMSFPQVLARSETQTVPFRVWILTAYSSSYQLNCNAKRASLLRSCYTLLWQKLADNNNLIQFFWASGRTTTSFLLQPVKHVWNDTSGSRTIYNNIQQ